MAPVKDLNPRIIILLTNSYLVRIQGILPELLRNILYGVRQFWDLSRSHLNRASKVVLIEQVL